ncbi:MAG TPA: type IV pilus assembly protein PilM [Solirubrobacterales bacterium]
MLRLTSKKKTGDVVGLHIEAGSVAAAQVRSNGSVEVVGAAIGPVAPGAFNEGEVADNELLADALKELFAKNKLSKQVRLGIGNQRVVVRSLRLPVIEDPKEMEAAVRFQAQEHVPMPLEEAVLEHQVVGGTPGGEESSPQVDVVVVAARRDMVSAVLDPLRKAGLEPVGVDLSAFGMIRALSGVDPEAGAVSVPAEGGEATDPATVQPGGAILYCNIGDAMNLAVAKGRGCLFTRVAATGLEGITGRLAAASGLTTEHATQWLMHVGLDRPLEQVEGDSQVVSDARRTLEEGVHGLVDELRLSLDYYGAQEGAVPVGRIVLSGPGSAIPGLPERMQTGLTVPISVARPPALSAYDQGAAARLTVPYGLALED